MRPAVIWIGITVFALVSLGLGYVRRSQAPLQLSALHGEAVYAATLEGLRDVSQLSRGEALASIFAAAARNDLDPITRAFEATHEGSGPGGLAVELLGELWARHDPEGALERASGWEPFYRREFLLPLTYAWARRDGSAAKRHVASLAGDKLRESAEEIASLGRFDARGDAGWDGYWADWPFGEDALEDVLGRVVRQDGLDGLIDRVEQLPDTAPHKSRVRAIRGVARLGGRIDPLRTTGFVERHADSGLEGLQPLRSPFVAAWSESDPRSALDWLLSQPPGNERVAAMRAGYKRWIRQATPSRDAIEWVESQPEDIRTSLLDLYVRALAPIDPSRALAAAEQLEPPNRDAVVRRIQRMVVQRDRAASGRASGRQRTAPQVETGAESREDGLQALPPPDTKTRTPGGNDRSSPAGGRESS